MRSVLLAVALMLGSAGLAAQDFSGVYDCKGLDAHEGAYTGVVTLKRVPEHSIGRFVSYAFQLEVPGFGTYPGEVVAEGNKLAMHFALDKPGSDDHGTGIATMRRDAKGRLAFDKFYFEREYKGGNTGTETCVRRTAGKSIKP